MGGILKYYSGGEWINAGQPDPLYAKATINDMVYPIGSIYANATNSENPATLLGVGTWVAFGQGRVPVGIDSGDTDFDTAEETGGHKELQTHTHGLNDPGHSHGQFVTANTGGTIRTDFVSDVDASPYNQGQNTYAASTGVTANNAGGGDSQNLQPYIVVYMWKRTA